MVPTAFWSRLPVRVTAGLVAGAAIVCMDNFAFEGEVSPIVIVAMLLAATATAGAVWGRRGWVPAAAAWVCVPLAHVIKHVLGLRDTLHPNTYVSILYLAVFTLVVATVGTGLGVLLHRPAARPRA
ncbi:MAG: hypothetical protein NTY02_02475 [Acidobacteria bacterium]|nr:hypothetical protein [Acidobacteriota bacterium]